MSWFANVFGWLFSPPPPPPVRPPFLPPPPPPPPLPSIPPGAEIMQITTSHGVALLSVVPLSYPAYTAYAVMQLPMPARASGDVSIVKATGEMTSALPYAVMVGNYLSLTPPADLQLPPQATPARGFDISPPTMHMEIDELLVVDDALFTRLGMGQSQPTPYSVYLIVYTSSTAETPGVTLTFNEPGYCDMAGVHFSISPTA